MSARPIIIVGELQRLVNYDPATGALTWLPRPREMFRSLRAYGAWHTKYVGKPAFSASRHRGYLSGQVRINGVSVFLKAHRVAWAVHFGEWPDVIDHINGDPSDNRIANLRSVTQSDNLKNRALSSNNRSGTPGVWWWAARKVWHAEIRDNGRKITLGSFAEKDDAIACRKAAEQRLGYHENHGRAA